MAFGFDLEFELGRLADEFYRPPRVFNARQLHHYLVFSLSLDRLLGNAELVDPVSDRLECLVNSAVLYPGHLPARNPENKGLSCRSDFSSTSDVQRPRRKNTVASISSLRKYSRVDSNSNASCE